MGQAHAVQEVEAVRGNLHAHVVRVVPVPELPRQRTIHGTVGPRRDRHHPHIRRRDAGGRVVSEHASLVALLGARRAACPLRRIHVPALVLALPVLARVGVRRTGTKELVHRPLRTAPGRFVLALQLPTRTVTGAGLVLVAVNPLLVLAVIVQRPEQLLDLPVDIVIFLRHRESGARDEGRDEGEVQQQAALHGGMRGPVARLDELLAHDDSFACRRWPAIVGEWRLVAALVDGIFYTDLIHLLSRCAWATDADHDKAHRAEMAHRFAALQCTEPVYKTLVYRTSLIERIYTLEQREISVTKPSILCPDLPTMNSSPRSRLTDDLLRRHLRPRRKQ